MPRGRRASKLRVLLRDGFLVHRQLELHIEWRPRHSLKIPRCTLRPVPRAGDRTEEGVLVRCYECGGEGVLIDAETDTALSVKQLPQITPPDPDPTVFDIARANVYTLLLWREERPLRAALALREITFSEYTWRRLNRDYTGLSSRCYEWNLFG